MGSPTGPAAETPAAALADDARDDSDGGAAAAQATLVPESRETFLGRDPKAVAAQAISHATPTSCQARTRLYRGGKLEREGFPVADISDWLADDVGRGVAGPAQPRPRGPVGPQRRVRAAPAGRRGRGPVSRADQARPVPQPPVPARLRRQAGRPERPAGHQRAGRVRHAPGADHGAQGRRPGHRHGRSTTGTRAPTWPSAGVSYLLHGAARLPRGQPLRRRPGHGRLHRGTRGRAVRRALAAARRCSGAASSCARAWSCCAGWCCRCARWSTP